MTKYRAIVLLSAYGKSCYLAEQVKSITCQMSNNDLLVIVDDGSAVVNWQEFEKYLPLNYIFWTRFENLGSSLSFIDLLMDDQWGSARHYFFADQDDIWYEKKMEYQISKTPQKKLSIHTVAEDWSALSEEPADRRLSTIIQKKSAVHYFFETPAPGMTMCLGAELRRELKVSETDLRKAAAILPHDRIISGCAGFLNSIVCIDSPLACYRQHGGNQIGAPNKRNFASTIWRRLVRFNTIKRQIRASQNLLKTWSEKRVKAERSQKFLIFNRLRQNSYDNFLMKIIILFS